MRKLLRYLGLLAVAVTVISTCYLCLGLMFGFVHPLNMCDKHSTWFDNPCPECECFWHDDCYPIED